MIRSYVMYPHGDLRLRLARWFFFVATIPGVTDVVIDAVEGGGGDFHTIDDGIGRCKEDILENVAAAIA